MNQHMGINWFKSYRANKPGHEKPISELGIKVVNILNLAYRGIYHIDEDNLLRADWSDNSYIEIVVRKGAEIATYGGSLLTDLVILCHLANVHLEITGTTRNCTCLKFMAVSNRVFRIVDPSIEEAVTRCKKLWSEVAAELLTLQKEEQSE